ncbi:chromosome segregation protein SMC [Weissella tructae]|uniref:chromosome segregation protein SMC n=1 Tax=Weissella tructae TaxID=887702 RepID=UPI001BDD1DC8|nr:chromosome segregation protein SMC [Weissella tructae]QVV91654.1 chromosome segregation protein SMC [Weissella tructae]
MKLKSLEISGFKSFAERTKIDFMPGITGVVGPNGSGKSNIIEAIRWVMGEQSARGLRGDKMADVIFGGSGKRAALNRAEVSITFDNTDRYLKSEYNEIRITRTLYRNGDSKYQINGTTVRLRDIQELFMDSGLGRESFSIISQGRVESIFSAKPEERRTIIEDVAGVYKYKKNKDKATKELDSVHDSLTRVEDILFELNQRIEPLAEQSAVAQDYVDQKAKFTSLDQDHLILSLNTWHQELADLQTQVHTQTNQREQVTTDVTDLEKQLASHQEMQATHENQLTELQQALLTCTTQVERLTGDLNLQEERQANREHVRQELQAKLGDVENELAELTEQMTTLVAQITQTNDAIEQLSSELTALRVDHPQQNVSQLSQRIEEVRSDLVETLQALATAKNQQQHLTQENQRQGAQSDRLVHRQETLQAQVQNTQVQQRELTDVHHAAQAELETVQTQLDKLQADGKSQQETYQAARQQWYEGLNGQQRLEARYESLVRLTENYDGYYQGVKRLMQQRDQFPGIHGAVAEMMTVSNEHQVAIETALGNALQQIIVDTTRTAKEVIQYMTKNRYGRVTLLPIETMQSRQLRPDQITTVEQQAGFVGIGSDLVKTKDDYAKIMQNLLGTTVIMDTLDHAVQASRALQQRVRLVTLDGQVMNPGGSMTGGANKQNGNGLLAQQAETEKVQADLTQQKTVVLALEETVREAEAALNMASETYQAEQKQVMLVHEKVQQAVANMQVGADRLTQLEKELTAVNYELRQLQATTEDADLASNLDAIAMHTQAQADLQQQLDDLQLQRQQAERDGQDVDAQIAQIQTVLATEKANLIAQQDRQYELERQVNKWQQTQNDVTQQLADLTANQADVQARLEHELQHTKAQREELVQRQVVTDTSLQQEKRVVQELQMTLQETQQKLQTQQADENAVQVKLTQRTTQFELAQQELLENYELTFEQIVGTDVTDKPLADIQQELKLIKRGLADIGDVNVGAIQEYEEVKSRHDFLQQQKDDLLSARTNLQQTMDEMDQEVERRFAETFHAIATAFEAIYVKMFGGGQAKLILTDPEHLLTTGVDIKAQPPGKKFQQMSLLSGGEKALTAISLLFAILAVRPVPFAVLDETEAALDEANVDRFAEYLHEVNAHTQFIVITHRKGTMTNADVLYGVTMQEPGVSTMVSVDLTDVTTQTN